MRQNRGFTDFYPSAVSAATKYSSFIVYNIYFYRTNRCHRPLATLLNLRVIALELMYIFQRDSKKECSSKAQMQEKSERDFVFDIIFLRLYHTRETILCTGETEIDNKTCSIYEFLS
uniref:Uncharacterized protein n=1 Tax=Cacopsylla melanoneura TaxID=428564 RepID=A0A8D8ZE47_9HEMI